MSGGKKVVFDLTKPLDRTQEKWLKSFFEAHPDEAFFAAGDYTFNGLTFSLSQSLARRDKHIQGLTKPLIKYDVLEKLDRGGFGVVYASKRTLTLGKKSLRVIDDNNHIVKLTSETDSANIYKTPLSELRAEQNLLGLGNRSRPKPLQHQAYDEAKINLLTMRRFKGQSLQALMDNDTLTPEQRLKLSLALLRALKEQVHDLNLIHRDIKPGNIIVDIDTMEVNIIDFGLCIQKYNLDGLCCGTPLYTSPEILLTPDRIDEKSDIYCMGRVLAQLWGDDHHIWHESTSRETYYKITATGQYNLSKLFETNKNAFVDIESPIRENIKAAIQPMVEFFSKKRSPVNDLMSKFHRTYLAQCCPFSDANNLSKSFENGLAGRKNLICAKNADIFLGRLKSELVNITDNKICIREFTHGLGWNALQSAGSRAAVITQAEKIILEYGEALRKYGSLLDKISTKLEKYKAISKTDVFSDFHELFHELDHKIDRINKRPFDFDWLQKSTKALNDKYTHWDTRLTKVDNDLEKTKPLKRLLPVITQLSSKLSAQTAVGSLDELKNKLREALQKYVSKTFTDDNILSKDRAASERRQKDIEDFNNIIETMTNETSLLNKTKKRIYCIETGFFGRSKLRSKLEKVIDEHKESRTKRRTT